jgi:triphosphatase
MLDLDTPSDSAPPETTKARPSRLARAHSVDDAIALILENCLEQVRANRLPTEDGRDPEAVHQMRIGLRRLRAALQFLGKIVPAGSFARFAAMADALADALGPVRNLDALSERLGMIDSRGRRALRRAIGARRADLYGEVRNAARSERCEHLLDDLAAWIAERGWRNEIPERKLAVLAKPARRLAHRALRRLERRAIKRGRRFARLGPQRRHKFRIATKKLRDAATLFAPMFDRADRYLKRLGKLQKALGEDHDAFVTPGLLEEIGRDTDSPDTHRAIGAVLRSQQHRRPALRKELRKRRRQWKGAQAFW